MLSMNSKTFCCSNCIVKYIHKSFTTTSLNCSTSADFETKVSRLHKLENGPASKVTVNRDDALKYYMQMQTIRRLETAAGNLYKEKVIRGFCHLYSGQEACAVGIKAIMLPEDSVISGYRVHGWSYLMGVEPINVLSELTGRKSGMVRGKGGSMHMYTKNFYGGNGIVGAQVPLGAGIAFAAKYLGTGGVCFTLYGDGASNQGQVFEAYNISKLWKIPCIFVCENNGYGMGTSSERSSANTDYYTRGDTIPGIQVDGMDVLAVCEAAKYAVEYCRLEKGPIVLEAVTYRYSGHSMSDPGTTYRSREEIQNIRQTRDPITLFKEKILSNKLASTDELKIIDKEVKKEIDNATKFAKEDAEIGIEELSADVYNNSLETHIRGVLPWKPVKHINISM